MSRSEDADKKRGFQEIINSPIYREFVISKDGNTSGILVYIKNAHYCHFLNLICRN